MAPHIEAIPSDPDLPRAVDVAVIGGGIVGVSAAYFLARKGASVALVEKGEIAGEQSARNMGWVRKLGRDLREMPLMLEAARLWAQLNDITGEETGFRATGITYFAESEDEVDQQLRWLDAAAPFQLDVKRLSGSEAMALAPRSTRRFVGALHSPSDGMAEPAVATVALAKAARRAGVKLFTRCAARVIDMQGGRIAGLFTERGHLACHKVVLAGGGWSTLFLRNLGVRLPQVKVLSQILRTAPVVGGPPGCGRGRGFSYRHRRDGGYNISFSSYPVYVTPDCIRFFADFLPMAKVEGALQRLRVGRQLFDELMMRRCWGADDITPFERERACQLDPTPREIAKAQRRFDIFPALRDAPVVEAWGGLIDMTPDAIPVISGVSSHPGLFLSTGYSGHGFGLGPGAGRLTAEIVAGESPCVDPSSFAFHRFNAGRADYRPSGL
ncbi:MAG: D-amino-acid oxidase [Proteobacteria bacterium]|nr:MAG: D-amino-acid oxidase [Pseudomonadota bacterium]